jgi:hypothetical protein
MSTNRPTHTPWGRPLAGDGRSAGPDDQYEGMFREVGLCEADARSAARGFAKGTYVSFEDAVASRAIFGHRHQNRVSPTKVAEVAARIRSGASADAPGSNVEQLLAEVAALAGARLGLSPAMARDLAEGVRSQAIDGFDEVQRLERRRDELARLPEKKS